MYLCIGQNQLLSEERIIGVFDLDTASYGRRAREFLNRAEGEGTVIDSSGELPKSFVVCDHPYHPQIIYLSQLSTATLQKRGASGKLEL